MSVFQLVYCSKNRITGSQADIGTAIDALLTSSRNHNLRAGISGALLFNGTAFAQLLEGPLAAVEDIFENIQCDDRHENIVLLRNAPAASRLFSDWSMAYADPLAVRALPRADIDLDAAFVAADASATTIVDLLRTLVVYSAA